MRSKIDEIEQGNNNLAVYYNNLKKLWDDLNRLRPLPICDCGGCIYGLTKRMGELDVSNKTIQFLMGLNDSFDGVRNQILMREPLPNVNKAYAMLLTVES